MSKLRSIYASYIYIYIHTYIDVCVIKFFLPYKGLSLLRMLSKIFHFNNIYTYIYICTCICVCVCVCSHRKLNTVLFFLQQSTAKTNLLPLPSISNLDNDSMALVKE